MTFKKNKYSLWITPSGAERETIQILVDNLARECKTETFIPHITLVANIYATDSELEYVKKQLSIIAAHTEAFTIDFTGYGYKNEKFRALYEKINSKKLTNLYDVMAGSFRQVHAEHFRVEPHMSVVYVEATEDDKQSMINRNAFPLSSCVVEGFELYKTNDPVSSWLLKESYSFKATPGGREHDFAKRSHASI